MITVTGNARTRNFWMVTWGLLFLTFHASGQETRVNTTNNNAWFMYFGNHKFSERFGLHAEAQLRRHDFLSEAQQLLLRTGIDYYLKENGRFTVGYAFVKTHPYGEFAVPQAFPEHRIWQQFTTSQTLGKVNLAHRYRLEQRMIGSTATRTMKDGRFENRFRYMAKAKANVARIGEKHLFVAVYDEIFINFGKEVAYNLMDQNRLYGAMGVSLSPMLQVELGYLYQLVQLRSLDLSGSIPKNRIENNYTFQLGVFSNIPLMKRG